MKIDEIITLFDLLQKNWLLAFVIFLVSLCAVYVFAFVKAVATEHGKRATPSTDKQAISTPLRHSNAWFSSIARNAIAIIGKHKWKFVFAVISISVILFSILSTKSVCLTTPENLTMQEKIKCDLQ